MKDDASVNNPHPFILVVLKSYISWEHWTNCKSPLHFPMHI